MLYDYVSHPAYSLAAFYEYVWMYHCSAGFDTAGASCVQDQHSSANISLYKMFNSRRCQVSPNFQHNYISKSTQ